MISEFWKVFLLSCLVTGLLTPVVIKIAPKIGAMDVPKDKRRMHDHPVPRIGGAAIFIGFISCIGFFLPLSDQVKGVYIAAALIFVIGLIDDLIDMPAKIKLAGQIVCALILWNYSLQIRGMANFLPFGPEYIVFPTPVSIVLTVLWIVAITNCINLIDGLDGLAAGVVFIASMSITYISALHERDLTRMLILSVAGACLGFLIWNFHPAKIFMGDCGAQLLGLLLASISLVGDTPTKSITLFSAILPMIILALPIFDTSFAIIRRTVEHKPIMEADKGHLHHRIMAMGFGHTRTVLVLYCISAIMGFAGIMWSMKMKAESILLMLIAGTLIFIFLGIGVHKPGIPRSEKQEKDE